MINILVTGGDGQLAACIKDVEAKHDNLNVVYTDYQNLDICSLEEIETFFKKHKVDYCINCAAYTAVDKAEEEAKEAYNINANGPKNLALTCKNHKAILIHISTDFVFDGIKKKPYTERDKPNAISIYGASKLKGEEEIRTILESYYILRTSWLYSEYGNNFLKTMLRLAENRDEISVVSDQIGSPTYARDLAEVIVRLITMKSKDFGLYHYSNEGAISWYDFAKAIFQESKVKIKVNPIKTENYPRPAKRPKYSVLDKSKIKQVFNIKIPYWEKSLKTALKNYDKQ